jgi:putative restriction endonuclease
MQENRIGTVYPGIGVIFDEHNGVVPDLVYASKGRLRETLTGGRLTGWLLKFCPRGSSNLKRDRHIKPGLYSTRGVDEYWIPDPESRSVEIYSRSADGALDSRVNLRGDDLVTSPVLRGFSVTVDSLFAQ